MKRKLLLGVCLSILVSGIHAQQVPGLFKASLSESNTYAFVQNNGQVINQFGKVRKDLDFKLEAAKDLNVFVGKNKIVYQWAKTTARDQGKITADMYRMNVELVGANKNASLYVAEQSLYKEYHYGRGYGDTGVKTVNTYKKITYRNVYPNIDWTLYVNEKGQVEYDFIVHEGGKVSDIKVRYNGASGLQLGADGALIASTPLGTIEESAPYTYQEDGQYIASAFLLEKNTVRYDVQPYRGRLIIDPVLKWGTYYGLPAAVSTTNTDYGAAVTCDALGNVYMTGNTLSPQNMATTGAFKSVFNGYIDAFLVKFDCAGNRVWATYYGGDTLDKTYGKGLHVDNWGNVYMTGYTDCKKNIATPGAYKTNPEGYDAFLVKFDSTGKRLWSTYFGGGKDENLSTSGIVTDQEGNVYIGGATSSTNGIASGNAFQSTLKGTQDGYLAKFDAQQGTLLWSTYYGGEGADAVEDIARDEEGFIYITGSTASKTDSTAIASPGAFRTALTGAAGGKGDPTYPNDAFLAKFSPEGNRVWGTYFGSDKADAAHSVAVNRYGHVYITGETESTTNIATTGAFQTALKGVQLDGFLARFNTDGKLIWGTYYGDSTHDALYSVTCDLSGKAIVAGRTNEFSVNNTGTILATPGSYQTQHGGYVDIIVAQFDSTGKRAWATYYGSTGADEASSIATDGSGNIYFTGLTGSPFGIATPGAFEVNGGLAGRYTGGDAYLVRFFDSCTLLAAPVLADVYSDTICAGSEMEFSVIPMCDISKYAWKLPQGWSGNSTTGTIKAITGSEDNVLQVAAINSCGDTGLFRSFTVNLYPKQFLTISVNGFVLSMGGNGNYISWQWYLNGNKIEGATDSVYNVEENGTYTVVVEDIHGCVDTSESYIVKNVGIMSTNGNDGVTIYPNPTNDVVYINAPKNAGAIITDIQGRVMQRVKNTGKISLSSFDDGMYIFIVYGSDGQVLKLEKIVKFNKN